MPSLNGGLADGGLDVGGDVQVLALAVRIERQVGRVGFHGARSLPYRLRDTDRLGPWGPVLGAWFRLRAGGGFAAGLGGAAAAHGLGAGLPLLAGLPRRLGLGGDAPAGRSSSDVPFTRACSRACGRPA